MIRRLIIIGFLVIPTIQLFGQKKIDLICGEWIQFGYKSHKENSLKVLTEDCSKKKCEFSRNGKYSEDMFCIKGQGEWAFNSDSTKLGFKITEFMGRKIKDDTPIKYFNSLIIKVTADTLVYGNEAYYGNERVYGHDDWYFVRKKK